MLTVEVTGLLWVTASGGEGSGDLEGDWTELVPGSWGEKGFFPGYQAKKTLLMNRAQ